jgi:hypothetical protein
MWRHVFWLKFTDVSEENIAPTYSVEEKAKEITSRTVPAS